MRNRDSLHRSHKEHLFLMAMITPNNEGEQIMK